jgi:hypothetical protein
MALIEMGNVASEANFSDDVTLIAPKAPAQQIDF